MIVIKGRIPSKKNNVNLFVKNGRQFKLPSNAYKEWHKDASIQLAVYKTLFQGIQVVFGGKLKVTITIFAPDKRKSDLSNKAESIMDLLVDNKIIEDDNWFVVSNLSLIFGGVDKDNPRAEITIQ
jgi:Holliday junction resolvase RusA-like endonuclease